MDSRRGHLLATRSRREVHTSLQGLQVLLALPAVRYTEELPHTLDCRQHTSRLTLQPPLCSSLQNSATASALLNGEGALCLHVGPNW